MIGVVIINGGKKSKFLVKTRRFLGFWKNIFEKLNN